MGINGSSKDPELFIRLMGSRGSLGGLSRAMVDVIRVPDLAGFDIIYGEKVFLKVPNPLTSRSISRRSMCGKSVLLKN